MSDDNLKHRIAREAATLLYFGAEKEYKQAKIKAAKTLGCHFLPSNLEVALELDKIAEENEGSARKERLVLMRREALRVMRLLGDYCPLLIGSVWRGTIRQGSDIDIAVYSDDAEKIVNLLQSGVVKIVKTSWISVNKRGATLESLHIYAETPAKHGLEIVVRRSLEKGEKRRCEVFGDQIKGLNTKQLENILQTDPFKRFLPT